MNKKLLGYYNYTVVLTYIGMIAGFIGILQAIEQKPAISLLCLLNAGFCDMFDGAIAQTMERTRKEKCFGIQIDSLSDLICFGVLPSILIYTLHPNKTVSIVVSSFYVLCALIRLAYFNVDEQERQKEDFMPRKTYYGMPVTLSALFIPLGYYFCFHNGINDFVVLNTVLFIMACLFLIPIPLKKPKKIGKIILVILGISTMILVIKGVLV